MAGTCAAVVVMSTMVWSVVFSAVKINPAQPRSLGKGGKELDPILEGAYPEDFQFVDSRKTADGCVRTKFYQKYKGRKVVGTSITVDNVENIKSIETGKVYIELEDDLSKEDMKCQIDKAEATATTLSHFPGEKEEDVYKSKYYDVIFVDSESKAHNALLVDLSLFTQEKGFRRLRAYVDQCDGTLLDAGQETGLGRATQTGAQTRQPADREHVRRKRDTHDDNCDIKGKAGNPNREINIGTPPYCLRDIKRRGGNTRCIFTNKYVKAVDNRMTYFHNISKPAKFKCFSEKSQQRDGINGGHSPLTDVFLFGTETFRMFEEWYDYQSKKNGWKVQLKAHFGEELALAYWDGTVAYFGDGDINATYPATTMDVVATILGWAVLEWSSSLGMGGQAGAIEFAFAFSTGMVAEKYLFTETNWEIGKDENYNNQGWGYFDDPTRDGFSIKNVSDWYEGIGYYAASGIYRYAFYQLSQEIGIRAAYEIFFDAARLYWNEDTDFEEGFCDILRAAYHAGYSIGETSDAFWDTGVRGENLCPDRGRLVTNKLKPGKPRRDLIVSNKRNPLFKIRTPAGPWTIQLDNEPWTNIYTRIQTSWQPWSSSPAVGQGIVTYSGSGRDTLFVRLYSDLETETITSLYYQLL